MPKGAPLPPPPPPGVTVSPGAWCLVTDHAPRCWFCGKLLGESLTRPWELYCSRCGKHNASAPAPAADAAILNAVTP